MAGKLRYWKEHRGRFWARIAVPAPLRELVGASQIAEPLGGDRRQAIKGHAAAVARLRARLAAAEAQLHGEPAPVVPREPITTADFPRAVWSRYSEALAQDDAARERLPSPAEVETAKQDALSRLSTLTDAPPLAQLDAALDYLVAERARDVDACAHRARLAELQRSLAAGETHLIAHEVDAYLDRNQLSAEPAERAVLGRQIMRAEIEAMRRVQERDLGDYTGRPADPLVKPAADATRDPVSLSGLWARYVTARVQAGSMRDGGKRQGPVVRNLRQFLKHNDASRITKQNLRDWRDALMAGGLSAKTVESIYLATVRSLLGWAHENGHLAENVAAGVRQPRTRKQRTREAGYTDAEAAAVLIASRRHQPKANGFGYVRETPTMTAAKQWVPILCAFTGARVSEIRGATGRTRAA